MHDYEYEKAVELRILIFYWGSNEQVEFARQRTAILNKKWITIQHKAVRQAAESKW